MDDAKDDDGGMEAAMCSLAATSSTLIEVDDVDARAADDAQADEDGAEARPLLRHLPKPTTTSAREAAGMQPDAHKRRQR
jgi:hypothetical protein